MVIPQTGSSPDGIKDENVFDIKTGVAISILVKKKSSDTSITYTELWGSAAIQILHRGRHSACKLPGYYFHQ